MLKLNFVKLKRFKFLINFKIIFYNLFSRYTFLVEVLYKTRNLKLRNILEPALPLETKIKEKIIKEVAEAVL